MTKNTGLYSNAYIYVIGMIYEDNLDRKPKGGSAKTTVTVNLVATLAERKMKILVKVNVYTVL